MVFDLERKLDRLTFEKDEKWESHVRRFHEINGNLAEYYRTVSPLEKVSKMIQTFPQRFAPM